eukprot:TRINITY_DN7000_c0_g1_i1.p1 TRINITY_DN7000_c0_g1~~TRINITY_DN7000_c0_g1_i1.p1  ORF type:complete len:1171 (+),score=235.86 TRINITY_DN7000_c0_g1_i1:506-3514(+)
MSMDLSQPPRRCLVFIFQHALVRQFATALRDSNWNVNGIDDGNFLRVACDVLNNEQQQHHADLRHCFLKYLLHDLGVDGLKQQCSRLAGRLPWCHQLEWGGVTTTDQCNPLAYLSTSQDTQRTWNRVAELLSQQEDATEALNVFTAQAANDQSMSVLSEVVSSAVIFDGQHHKQAVQALQQHQALNQLGQQVRQTIGLVCQDTFTNRFHQGWRELCAGNTMPPTPVDADLGRGARLIGLVTAHLTIVLTRVAGQVGHSAALVAYAFTPGAIRNHFVVGHDSDGQQAIMASVQDRTRTYKCNCGFTYAVGNCGQLNGAGRCPVCRSPIGNGGAAIPVGNMQTQEAGFLPAVTQSPVEAPAAIRNLSPAQTAILDLFTSSAFLTGQLFNATALDAYLGDHATDFQRIFTKRVAIRVRQLMQMWQLGLEETCLVLHRIISDLPDLIQAHQAGLTTANERQAWEAAFVQATQPLLNNPAQTAATWLQRMQQNLDARNDAVGVMGALQEREPPTAEQPAAFAFMRLGTVDASRLLAAIRADADLQERHPLLHVVADEFDKSLPFLAQLRPLMKFIRFVRSECSHVMKRKEAATLTIQQFVVNIPAPRQHEARLQANDFIEAWNDAREQARTLLGGDDEAPYGRLECEPLPPIPMLSMDSPIALVMPDARDMGVYITAFVKGLAARQSALLQQSIDRCPPTLFGQGTSVTIDGEDNQRLYCTIVNIDNVREQQLIHLPNADNLGDVWRKHALLRYEYGRGHQFSVDWEAMEREFFHILVNEKAIIDAESSLAPFEFQSELGVPLLKQLQRFGQRLPQATLSDETQEQLGQSQLRDELDAAQAALEYVVANQDRIDGLENKSGQTLGDIFDSLASNERHAQRLHSLSISNRRLVEVVGLYDLINRLRVIQQPGLLESQTTLSAEQKQAVLNLPGMSNLSKQRIAAALLRLLLQVALTYEPGHMFWATELQYLIPEESLWWPAIVEDIDLEDMMADLTVDHLRIMIKALD